MESDCWNQKNIILLIFLSVIFLPLGLIFLLWIMRGKKGLFLGIGCVTIPVFFVLFWVGLVWYANFHPEFGEHVAHVDWLPPEATNISFYKTYSYTAYEFSAPEHVFRQHVNSAWTLKEITTPVVIPRYHYVLEMEKFNQQFPQYDHDAYTQLQQRITATVKNGVVAEHRQSNGGGYHVVYDRDTGIAYVQTSPR